MRNMIRFCPNCNKKIKYKTEIIYKTAKLKNSDCKSCSKIGRKISEETRKKMSISHHGRKHTIESKKKMSIVKKGINLGKKLSEETKRKISNSNIGKHHLSKEQIKHLTKIRTSKPVSKETREKMSKSQTGKIRSDEYKLKMSLICKITQPKGENSIHFGKKHSKETKRKISEKNKGRKLSKETKEKISNGNKGKIRTDEYKLKMSMIKTGKTHTTGSILKMRLSRIKEIESKYGQVIPNYNTTACQYFNKIMEETNIFIQHAENLGEYHIKEIGYWLDGYDKENNIVYEWDEKRHFDNKGNLKPHDIQREKEIINHLKCKFIRIKDQDMKNNLI